MDDEKWLPIPDFDDYEVSDMGRVRSYKIRGSHERAKHPLILKPGTKRTGYKYVNLRRDDLSHNLQVHQIVLLAFVGKCPNGLESCHNNGNPADNRLSNLRYDTHSSNMQDAIEQGHLIWSVEARNKHADIKQRVLLRKHICQKIISMKSDGMSHSQIKRATGYSISAISRIVNGNRRPYLNDRIKIAS